MAGARLAGLSGHTDWRVPNITDLHSLAEFEAPTAMPDAVAFPVWPVYVHSSTTEPSNTLNEKLYLFTSGQAGSYGKTNIAVTVLTALVRG